MGLIVLLTVPMLWFTHGTYVDGKTPEQLIEAPAPVDYSKLND